MHYQDEQEIKVKGADFLSAFCITWTLAIGG